MANRKRIKKTKAYTLDVADEEYIKEIAELNNTNSDSEALRLIIREHKLSFSATLSSMKDFLQSNQPAAAPTA